MCCLVTQSSAHRRHRRCSQHRWLRAMNLARYLKNGMLYNRRRSTRPGFVHTRALVSPVLAGPPPRPTLSRFLPGSLFPLLPASQSPAPSRAVDCCCVSYTPTCPAQKETPKREASTIRREKQANLPIKKRVCAGTAAAASERDAGRVHSKQQPRLLLVCSPIIFPAVDVSAQNQRLLSVASMARRRPEVRREKEAR